MNNTVNGNIEQARTGNLAQREGALDAEDLVCPKEIHGVKAS